MQNHGLLEEEKTKEELVSRLDGIKEELESSLTSDFQSKIDQRELNVSDDFLNLMRNEFDIKLNELRDELYSPNENSIPVHTDQYAAANTNGVTEAGSEGSDVPSDNESLYNDDDLNN